MTSIRNKTKQAQGTIYNTQYCIDCGYRLKITKLEKRLFCNQCREYKTKSKMNDKVRDSKSTIILQRILDKKQTYGDIFFSTTKIRYELGINSQLMSYHTRKLYKKGFLERLPKYDNNYMYRITDKGKKELKKRKKDQITVH